MRLLLAACAGGAWAADGPAKVLLEPTGSGETAGWCLRVNGNIFPVHGAGGAKAPGMLEKLKEAGGNCVRSWGIQEMEDKVSDGKRFIDRAQELGIKVVPGIWIGHERHGFNYGDAAMVKKQRDEMLAAVRKYKSHPAVLMWGIGNEMEGFTASGSTPVYKEIEELAKLVKQEDPNHPVMTVISFNPAKIPGVKEFCPSIDVLGINSYGSAGGAGEAMRKAGWTKPFAVTEFGVSGHWEVGKTSWGAPLEQDSQDKARSFYATQKLVTQENAGKELCLGTFVFLWGSKQECTPTWYGMFLSTGERLPMVDAMTYSWTGSWPANRCPKVKALVSPIASKTVKPGQTVSATFDVASPGGDRLTYDWDLLAENVANTVGGDHEAAAESFKNRISNSNTRECTLKTPTRPGAYRLFAYVRDSHGGAATANLPFLVEP